MPSRLASRQCRNNWRVGVRLQLAEPLAGTWSDRVVRAQGGPMRLRLMVDTRGDDVRFIEVARWYAMLAELDE